MVPKPLWLVFMTTMQLIINGRSRAQVTVIQGHDVTLQFTFNINITNNNHFAVYVEGGKKKAEHCPWKGCSRERGFDIYSEKSSVFCQITNLTQGHSGTYSARLFSKSEPTKESNKVHLIVQEEKSNNSVLRAQENRNTTKYPPSFFSSVTNTSLVVLPVISFAATLPWFFCCCVRARANKARKKPSPSTQVACVATNIMPEADLAYSVLDFPKREATLPDSKPNDSEYVHSHIIV
ncbi:uncharacterized protein LOC109518949 [Hippocampus comes]|uniref:uncharacterized protein LOC109518949 n=1 Tax=Hippocampus comes TaxID=109280 RepID=UPI00094E9B93|nr:PREDICTED: uncharacterized protein LOC109518949 [Hippocampus comes]